ncbi:hypothetical protein PENTCL1PPCAC_366 [Pristionchus entomophagus]|uniref:F-box domain-containing protein n=1 Tax=Pristionchus entomophagus TaxID=358040 RepID=A0AAV5S672_9BILA|nr:hypothetical protein PENTCL1PPCAC_366 [Pristionchus entomophagus]
MNCAKVKLKSIRITTNWKYSSLRVLLSLILPANIVISTSWCRDSIDLVSTPQSRKFVLKPIQISTISVSSRHSSILLLSILVKRESILPSINLSILHNFAQNAREVDIWFACFHVSAHDLCTLRKIMLKGDCKLVKCTITLEPGIEKLFVKECFGVTIEEVKNREERIWTRIYLLRRCFQKFQPLRGRA